MRLEKVIRLRRGSRREWGLEKGKGGREKGEGERGKARKGGGQYLELVYMKTSRL